MWRSLTHGEQAHSLAQGLSVQFGAALAHQHQRLAGQGREVVGQGFEHHVDIGQAFIIVAAQKMDEGALVVAFGVVRAIRDQLIEQLLCAFEIIDVAPLHAAVEQVLRLGVRCLDP
jgi:hypothetical protein